MSESAPGDALIEVRGVSKWFGNVVAVSDVSFDIGSGITALLGPNGAGKSTMLRMLCGLARPSKGTVRLLGSDPRSNIAVTRQLGLVPQQEGVFEALTALAFVRLSADLHGLPDADGAARHWSLRPGTGSIRNHSWEIVSGLPDLTVTSWVWPK